MPGVFSKAARPTLPGAYVNFEVVSKPVVLPTLGGIVAVMGTHDWGPVATPTLVLSFAEFEAIFGTSDSPLRRAALQLFQGENIQNRRGAGGVLVYRIADSSASAASLALMNTAGTPATATTLNAKQVGSYGENIKVRVQDSSTSGNTELLVYVGSQLVERFEFDDTDIDDLVDQITSSSDWIETSGTTVSGTALADVPASSSDPPTPLAGGDDGDSAILGGDVTDGLGALEVERFGIFCFADLEDMTFSSTDSEAVLTSTRDWAIALNKRGKRFRVFVGGPADETVSDANDRSALLADVPSGEAASFGELFCNLGVSSVIDSSLGASPVTLTSSACIPRVAGIAAQRGEAGSLTFARLGGCELLTGATESDTLIAYDGGTMVLGRDSNTLAPVKIIKATTTYVSRTDSDKPVRIYRNPKYVATMMGLEMELTEWAESPDGPIGSSSTVNEKTREAVVAMLSTFLRGREDAGVLQPGSTVGVDPDPPPSDDDEFVAVIYGIRFGRHVEQVFATISVS